MNIEEKYLDYRLCFVENKRKAYFTNDFENQSGDDWDDGFYDCNAGAPYEKDKDYPNRDIFTLLFEADMDCFQFFQELSVEQINAGVAAWMSAWDRNSKTSKTVVFPGGMTLREFIEKMQRVGGTIFLPIGGEMEQTA